MTSLAIANRSIGFSFVKDYQSVTSESDKIRQVWNTKPYYLRGSALDWLPSIEATLGEIRLSCSKDNWDGEGANAVCEPTIGLTLKIVQQLYFVLPKGTPAPDLMAESDGEIAISWFIDPTHLFAMSIGAHGMINFSGMYGKNGGIHGWIPINSSNENIEKSLEQIVRQITNLYT